MTDEIEDLGTLDNFYVSTNGADSNDGRSWNSALLTLQAAIVALGKSRS